MITERRESLELNAETTRRFVNPGAEKWLGEVIPVLDHGFVYLVDYMGGDESIVQAARVSYGTGTKSVSEDRTLIRFLLRHRHTTPFEMVEFKFHAKMPIAVAREWVRHRTANINEYSARYSILDKEFYIPAHEEIAGPPSGNRQGRGEPLDRNYAEEVRKILIADALQTYDHYSFLLNDDGAGNPADPNRPMVARETARFNLPVDFYTQWYWKIDLHNLLHFLSLRMDSKAQMEIRMYANAMAQIVKDAAPLTWEAFEDYQVHALHLSRLEGKILSSMLGNKGITFSEEDIQATAKEAGLKNKRERAEMIEKFRKLGLTGEETT